MTKKEIADMLWTMGEMVKEASNGTIFTEVSTYVKNKCPNIEPEYIEIFRDTLHPIIQNNIEENELVII